MLTRFVRNWLAVLILSATIGVLFWLGCAYTLSHEHSHEAILDRQAASWIEGRWDVPRTSEIFEHGGKYYYYFGPLPSLFHLLFLVVPAAKSADHGFVLFGAAALNLAGAILVLYALAQLLGTAVSSSTLAIFSLAGGIGSSLAIITSRPSVYHETIAWGAGFALMAAWAFVKYLLRPGVKWLVILALFALAATFSRQTWLLTSILLLAGIAPMVFHKTRSYGQAFLPIAAIAILAAGVLTLGYIKFGSPRITPPLEQHVDFQTASRLDRAGGSMFRFLNLRSGIVNYFAPDTISFERRFPYIGGAAALRIFPEARYDGTELFISLPWSMGTLLVLSVVGIVPAFRSHKVLLVPWVALVLGAAPLFIFIGLCARYLHDFYPALVFGGALGILQVRAMAARIVMPVLAIFAVANAAADMGIAFRYQIEMGPAARTLALVSLAGFPPNAGNDQWARARMLTFSYRLNEIAPGANYPLMTMGVTGDGSFVWLRVSPKGETQYCFNSCGHADVPCSAPVDVRANRPSLLSVNVQGTRVVLKHNGATVLDSAAAFGSASNVFWLGQNPIGGGLTLPSAPGTFTIVTVPPNN